MGLYDWIILKVKCPHCKHKGRTEFQTYALGRSFNEFALGDYVGISRMDLIGTCDGCKCSFNGYGVTEEGVLKKVIIYSYTFNIENNLEFKHNEKGGKDG